MANQVVLPRPGATSNPSKPPISAPAEAAFTDTFGKLLPPVQYIRSENGNIAYYDLPPSSTGTTTTSKQSNPARVLLIHGIQTPAIGMLPLTRVLQAAFPQTHFVLVDLWGHGLTDTPVLPHEPGLFHNLLDLLLDHVQWPTAHIIGYSFGGALSVGYVSSRTSRIESFILIAPAGLIHASNLKAEDLATLHGSDEALAQAWVLDFLQGGEPPSDWKERVARGEIVAAAVRDWEMLEHAGHLASVVAIIRDGGAFDNDEQFIKAVRTGVPNLVVLGELDDVCNKEELEEIGFRDVFVVKGAGHAVSRENTREVAGFIKDFWIGLAK